MVICDTGPLIAIIDATDPYHNGTRQMIVSLGATQLITTVPCLTEAFYFLHRFGGWNAQSQLWLLLESGGLQIDDQLVNDLPRISDLMQQYRDAPMDFADASLVALAERLGVRQLMTIDRHFYSYRLVDGAFLEVLFPERG
jgi:predicted nucleic acid-binding protein